MIKKLAATTAVNDADIEKAFADQASGFVENKLGPLMKAPHNIGFEVVRKSDDNTRIIGIFAFKVEDSLLFAPVFFLNGDIKGPLLYRCDTKTFVPANKDWATYLIGSIQDSEGRGNSTSLRGNYPPYVMMDKMTFSPTREKRAGVDPTKQSTPPAFKIELNPSDKKEVVVNVDSVYSPSDGHVWDGTMMKIASCEDGTVLCTYEGDSFLLRKDDGIQFEKSASGDKTTLNTPDGRVLILGPVAHDRVHTGLFKKSSTDQYNWDLDFILPFVNMIEAHPLQSLIKESKNRGEILNKVLDAADSSPKFTENLMECYDSLESLVPDSPCNTEKKASAAGELKIVYTANSVPVNQDALTRFFKDEYYITDTRDKSSLSEAYTCDPISLETINYSGVYDLLKPDSSYEDNVLVVPTQDDCPCDSCESSLTNDIEVLLIKGNKICSEISKNIYGIRKSCVKHYPLYTDTVSDGKTYVILDNDTVNGFIKVISTKKSDDVTYITSYRRGHSCFKDTYNGNHVTKVYMGSVSESPIVINRRSSSSNDSLFGARTRFVEVSPSKEEDGTIYFDYLEGFDNKLPIDNIIWNEFSEPRITVSVDDSFSKEAKFRIESLGEKSPSLSKLNMLVKLARDLKIPADDAYNIVDKASENGSYSFMLNGVEKQAFKLRIAEHPRFDNEFDSELGIPVEPHYEYKLDTQAEQVSAEPSHIGDSYDPSTLSGLSNATVVSSDPASLRELADTYKLPHVFEHGVVGTLADTFDSIAMLDKYIGKIEDAVDALYRILFLFYWKPGDFEKLYGTDDMTNFEAETRADTESLGALLLRLLKKTENYRKGNMPTSGEEQSIK